MSIVWTVPYPEAGEEIEYEVAVVFRLRNPAASAMPEAAYRVRLTDSRGSVLDDSPSQRTALAASETRHVVYARTDLTAAGNPADRSQVAQRAPKTATVTTSPSALGAQAIPPSSRWRPHNVLASCDAEGICAATGEVEWTGDRPAPAPNIAVVAFGAGGRLVAAGLAGGSGAQLRPRQREEFEVIVIAASRKKPARVEIVPYLQPD
ncbi:hypothetical protein ACPCHT_02985 [Nucisporomicrobium flavum]|uniref:hypothetical protein n=1 Tax=Nucisporomicrobium flavum TaxID=2785915 RepID=UPI003C2F9C6F